MDDVPVGRLTMRAVRGQIEEADERAGGPARDQSSIRERERLYDLWMANELEKRGSDEKRP
jgi:hypothetical protein